MRIGRGVGCKCGLNACGWAPAGLTPALLTSQGLTTMPQTGIHTVTVPGAYEAGWPEVEDGGWVEANLSTADRTDLMFLNVEAASVHITVVAPDGTPHAGREAVLLLADEIRQVSFYSTQTAYSAGRSNGGVHLRADLAG